MSIERQIHYGKVYLQFPLLKKILKEKEWSLDEFGFKLKLSPISRKLLRQGYAVKKYRDKVKIKNFIKESLKKEIK